MERERDEKSDEHRRAAHSRAHNPLTSGSTAFLQVASERNVVASSLHHRRRRLYSSFGSTNAIQSSDSSGVCQREVYGSSARTGLSGGLFRGREESKTNTISRELDYDCSIQLEADVCEETERAKSVNQFTYLMPQRRDYCAVSGIGFGARLI